MPTGPVHGDILLAGGKIAAIGPRLREHAATIIDEPGLTVFPGFIDAHVHFREPGAMHKECIQTGSQAAAAGGITSFFEMPNTTPATTDHVTLDNKLDRAAQTSLINYAFFIGATKSNIKQLDQIHNIPGIKLFAGSSTGDLLLDNPADWSTLFQSTRHLISVHAEDDRIIAANRAQYSEPTAADHPRIRSVEAALVATRQLVELAIKHNRRLHICHLTTAAECDFLAKLNNPLITTEVTPQHLYHTDADYAKHQTLLKINPPIRDATTSQALFRALKSGVIQFIGSDHAPHTLDEKLQPYAQAPSGMPIVQFTVPLLLNWYNQGRVSLVEIARWLSEAPASIYRVKNKGTLAVGTDADITVVDTKTKRSVDTLYSRCGWSTLTGETLTGWPVITIVNGQIAYREGDFYTGAAQPVQFHH